MIRDIWNRNITTGKLSSKEYWILTLFVFVFFSAGSFFLELVFNYWTHIFTARTVRRIVLDSLFMGIVFAFLFPPMMRFYGKKRWIG